MVAALGLSSGANRENRTANRERGAEDPLSSEKYSWDVVTRHVADFGMGPFRGAACVRQRLLSA